MNKVLAQMTKTALVISRKKNVKKAKYKATKK